MKWIAPFLALALAGCITSQDQQISQDDTRCLSYGAPKGSPEYVRCREQLDQNRANVRAAERFGKDGGLIGAIRRSQSD